MGAFWAKVFEETKAVPMTLMLLLGAYGALVFLLKDHVTREDLNALKANITALSSRVDGVKAQLRYDHLDSELHKTETDLFNLEQHKADLIEARRPVDAVVLQRIDELTLRHADLLRQLARASLEVAE